MAAVVVRFVCGAATPVAYEPGDTMATKLIQTINRIKDSLNEAALRGEYDRACVEFAGDAAAMFAICEATCARKERYEYLANMKKANALQARIEQIGRAS